MKKEKAVSGRLYFFFALLALLPRLPFIFRLNGHDASLNFITVGRDWLATGRYPYGKPPGSPVYELALGLIDLPFKNSGLPFRYYTNILSVLAVFVTLTLIYKIFRKYLSEGRALLGVVLFNFYPWEWIMGGGTTDSVFMVLFGACTFYALSNERWRLALVFAFLAAGSRIQCMAYVVPVAWLFLKREKRMEMPSKIGFILALTAVIFYPGFSQHGFGLLFQPYHHGQFTFAEKVGAVFNRALNSFGPAGVPILLYVVYTQRKRLMRVYGNPMGFAATLTVALTLFVFARAPWETFYLLPVVPIAIFLMLKLPLPKWALPVFVASTLLPSLIQIQMKPWKLPPVAVKMGVLEAHSKEAWIIRGGG